MANLQIVPAPKNVKPQYVEMKVPLYSYGCEKKVKNALSQLRGIHSVHVDYDLQKVTVWGICNRDTVLATIRKKRREACFWDQINEDFTTTVLEPAAEMAKEAEKINEDYTTKVIQPAVEMAEEASPPESELPGGNKRRHRAWKKLLPLVLYRH